MNVLRISCFILAFMTALATNAQTYKDWVKKTDPNSPKETIVKLYNLQYKEPFMNFPDSTIWIKEICNKKGLHVHKEHYEPIHHGNIFMYTDFKYDHKNRLVEKTEYSNEERGHGWNRIMKFFYDDKSKTVRVDYYSDNELYEFTRYIYKKEKIDSIISYWEDSTINYMMTCEYLKKENQVRTTTLYEKKTYLDISTYNKQGKELKSISYSPNDTISTIHHYTYDKKGNLVQEKETSGKKETLVERINYYYNMNNQLIKKEFENEKGEIIEKFEFGYDLKNRPLFKIEYNDEGKQALKFVYEYH